jgi:hypothetical protein
MGRCFPVPFVWILQRGDSTQHLVTQITLDDAHTTGVEVDGGGDTHYVRALGAGPSWLKCM